jgi:uncharacterized protein YggE
MNKEARLFLALSVMLGAFASASVAGTSREIVVSGTAELSVTPDVVVWRIRVNTENSDLEVAKRVNDERVRAVLVVAQEIADESKDVEAGPVRIDRRYARNDTTKLREFTHYSVRRSIVVTQRKIDDFEDVLHELVSSTEVEVSFSYEVSNAEEIRDRLRLKALDVAKTKAKSMVESMGGALGQVLTISEFRPRHEYPGDVLKGSPPPPKIIEAPSPEARLISETVYATFEIK